jgi:hypothetical protein
VPHVRGARARSSRPGAPGHARLATLRERLRCVGGASAERTLALALEHLEKRARPESAPPTDGDASEASRSTIRACDVLVDLAWEKLHTGDWKDVDEAWRDLYVMASMAVADARGGFAPARAAETLASLDRASLLGGPTFRDELERAIAHAQEAMESDAFSKKRTRKRRTRLVVRALGDDAEDDVVAALPPGSLGARDAKAVSAKQKQKQKRETKTSEEDTETNRARRATLIRLASAREPVATFASPPSLERFLTDAMAPGEPAVLKGLAFAWPAFAKWRDPTYLRAVAGARTVPVETGEHYLHATHARELVTLDAFLDEYVFVENARDERDETFEKKALSRSALGNSETSVSDAPVCFAKKSPKKMGYLAQHALLDQIPKLSKRRDRPRLLLFDAREGLRWRRASRRGRVHRDARVARAERHGFADAPRPDAQPARAGLRLEVRASMGAGSGTEPVPLFRPEKSQRVARRYKTRARRNLFKDVPKVFQRVLFRRVVGTGGRAVRAPGVVPLRAVRDQQLLGEFLVDMRTPNRRICFLCARGARRGNGRTRS